MVWCEGVAIPKTWRSALRKRGLRGPPGPVFFFFFSPLSTINHLKSRAKRLENFRKYGWPGGAEMSVLGGGLPYFGPPLNAV